MIPAPQTRLRLARLAHGLSQPALGRLASIHPTDISHFEHGRKRPTATQARRLALALQVDPSTLHAAIDWSQPHDWPV